MSESNIFDLGCFDFVGANPVAAHERMEGMRAILDVISCEAAGGATMLLDSLSGILFENNLGRESSGKTTPNRAYLDTLKLNALKTMSQLQETLEEVAEYARKKKKHILGGFFGDDLTNLAGHWLGVCSKARVSRPLLNGTFEVPALEGVCEW